RAARQCYRPALRIEPAYRRLQHQHWAASLDEFVPHYGDAMIASNNLRGGGERRALSRLGRSAAILAAAINGLTRAPRANAPARSFTAARLTIVSVASIAAF